MKKIISIALVILLMLSFTTMAFADEADAKAPITGNYDNDRGSITINKYNADNEYAIYQMLLLESFSTAGDGVYSYTIHPQWEEFFIGKKDDAGNVTEVGAGAEFITLTGKYVTWAFGSDDSRAPEFAKKALAYAKDKKIAPLENSKNAISDEITVEVGTATINGKDEPICVFGNLRLGWYLVDSTMGALCGLTTTNLNASINAKNGEPTMTKYVYEDANSQWWTGDQFASEAIGNLVYFKININIAAGAENYIIHDVMPNGLTLKPDSFKITYNNATVDSTVTVGENNIANYTIITNPEDGHTFDIKFSKDYCDTLEDGKILTIEYSALLNENATIAGEGETNKAWLTFGDDHKTAESTANVRCYAFDLVKTDGQNFLLDGAFFEVYVKDENNLDKQVYLVKETDDDGNYYYRPATVSDDDPITGAIEVDGGIVRFQGFESGDIYFKETKAPVGYNQLSSMAKYTLGHANNFAIFNNEIYSSGSGFHVTNKAGTMLPETGGIGTLLFTLLGGTTALGTGVVLVTKKRMSKIKDED